MPSNPNSPRAAGFRMPAEWEVHEGTWLSWPKDPITFPRRVRKVQQVYCQIIQQLVQGEKVFLLLDNEKAKGKALRMLEQARVEMRNVHALIVPTVDVWIRDYGPNFLVRGKTLAYNHWIFNAWGRKYEELLADTEVPKRLLPFLNRSVFTPGIVLEGGSIDVNGQGLCLTTTQCLLAKNRNPDLDKQAIENYLRDYLNVQEIIWLGDGVEGDDTDGHVDDIARFVAPDTVVCAREENPSDNNYRALRANFEILQARFQTIPLPMPSPIQGRGARLPASYANFFIANACVLVPIYQDPMDGRAIGILRELFPGRRVVGIPCQDLIWGMGAIHCITQQQPASSPIALL